MKKIKQKFVVNVTLRFEVDEHQYDILRRKISSQFLDLSYLTDIDIRKKDRFSASFNPFLPLR